MSRSSHFCSVSGLRCLTSVTQRWYSGCFSHRSVSLMTPYFPNWPSPMAAWRLRSFLRSFLPRLLFLWCLSRLLFFSSLRLRLRPLREPLSLSELLPLLSLRFPPPADDAKNSRRCACAAATSQAHASSAARSITSDAPGTARVRPASASASAAAFCFAKCFITMLSPRVSASPGWPRVNSVVPGSAIAAAATHRVRRPLRERAAERGARC